MDEKPYIFDEFFASGMEESISPFLTDKSRFFGKNLSLKSACLGGFFLLVSFISSYTHPLLTPLFLIITYFLSGTKALIETVEDIKNFEINIDVLMTLAAFLSVLIGSPMEGALLLVLFSISGAMEETVSNKSKSAVTNLTRLSPTFAKIIDTDGSVYDKSVREILIGMRVLVPAGEIIPLDGKVIDGRSFVNLVHLTGESEPLSKTIGSDVQAGSQNLDGTLTVEVTRTNEDSTLMRIIRLVSEAQETKPQVQRFLDRFSKIYATTIISLSALFALILPHILGIPYLGAEGGIYRALAFLIAASPCALIIATPTAYLSALSACARKGILIKGGVILDAIASTESIAFDKTGTLTTGQLTCSKITPVQATLSLDEALAIAASLERHSTHPIGAAILRLAAEKNLKERPVTNFNSVAGYGLEAEVEGRKVSIGNLAFIKGKTATPISPSTDTCAALLIDSDLFLFEFYDQIRPGMPELISQLKNSYGIESIMLTGDHPKSAAHVASKLNISQVYADLRPEDKLLKISELAKTGHVAMIGDGVNDAPALARATVGISMGKVGSGAAIEASDVVLLQDDLHLLEWLLKKGRKTTRIVRENLILALGVILLATTPALLGYIPLWLAVILHEGGTLLVGINSLRLLR